MRFQPFLCISRYIYRVSMRIHWILYKINDIIYIVKGKQSVPRKERSAFSILGKYYLSELVKLDMLQKDKLNIIKAPTGSGKTYFALTAIPSTVPDAIHKVVHLIDTINGKEQILQNYNARPIYRLWETEVNGFNFDDKVFETEQNIVIITYAKFGSILERDPDFHKNFDYIICDELHNLIRFQHFSAPPTFILSPRAD